jgi:hypothetical protein
MLLIAASPRQTLRRDGARPWRWTRRFAISRRTATAADETRRVKAEGGSDGERTKLKRAHVDLEDVKAKRLIDAKEAKRVASGVRNRLARGVTRNIGAIPAESVPYIGIGVMLGMVGLDLYDACETMKEVMVCSSSSGRAWRTTRFAGMKVPTRDQVLADLNATWRASYERGPGRGGEDHGADSSSAVADAECGRGSGRGVSGGLVDSGVLRVYPQAPLPGSSGSVGRPRDREPIRVPVRSRMTVGGRCRPGQQVDPCRNRSGLVRRAYFSSPFNRRPMAIPVRRGRFRR